MKNITLSSRATTVVLVASLALNLFLITWGGVSWYQKSQRRHWPSVEAIEQRYADRLTGDDAALFRRVLDAHRTDLSARVEAGRQARERARLALQGQPFERVQLEAALAENRQAMAALQGSVHSILLEAAAGLSTAGRQHLFDQPER